MSTWRPWRLLYAISLAETAPLVVQRLAALPRPVTPLYPEWRDLDLLGAVAWSPSVVVRTAVSKFFRKTTGVEVFLVCVPALGPGDRAFFSDRVNRPAGYCEQRQRAFPLQAAVKCLGPDARPVFQHFMGNPTSSRAQSLCLTIGTTPEAEWALDLLFPYLDRQGRYRVVSMVLLTTPTPSPSAPKAATLDSC